MSELQFPKDPVVGQQYDFPPYKYYWDGTKWKTMGIGYNPVNDLRDELEPRIEDLSAQSFEALRRSYAEAGLNLVDGSFEEGGTLTSASDVLLHKASGKVYSGPIGSVVAGTDPTAVGSGYVPRTDVVLRSNLNGAYGANQVGFIQPGVNATKRTVAEKLTELSVNLFDYVKITDTDYYPAFFRAAKDNVDVITVPAGEYTLDNLSGDKLANIVVFGSTKISCQGDVTFKFTYNGLPLFTWLNAASGGISGNCKFVFTGSTQTVDDYTVAQLRTRLGITAMVVGGSYETRTVILRVNSNNVSLGGRLHFKSETEGDATKGICFCIVDKGMEESSTQSVGNRLGECIFEDCIHGVLSSRQDRFEYNGPFFSKRRFGHATVAPGHIMYLSGLGANGLLTNGNIGDVVDYGNPTTIGDGVCMAPMAVKGVHGCTFGKLTSMHPEGLTQSYTDVIDCLFGEQTYIYNGVVKPTMAHINFAGVSGETCSNCIFKPIVAISKTIPFRFASTSSMVLDGNVFDKILIVTPHDNADLAGAHNGIIDVHAKNNVFNIEYLPSEQATASYYQLPFIERLRTDGNDVNIKIVGRHASRYSCRILDVGEVNLDVPSRIDDIDRNWDSALCPIYRRATQKTEWGTFSASIGANSKTYQLPAKGSYIISASIDYADKLNSQSVNYLVSYSSALSLSSSQQIGTTISTGTKITGISISVDTAGVVTLSYNSTSATVYNINFSFVRLGNISS